MYQEGAQHGRSLDRTALGLFIGQAPRFDQFFFGSGTGWNITLAHRNLQSPRAPDQTIALRKPATHGPAVVAIWKIFCQLIEEVAEYDVRYMNGRPQPFG